MTEVRKGRNDERHPFTGLDQGSSPSNPTVRLLALTMYSIFNN